MSPYLLAILVAWLAAQGAKYVASVVRTGKLTDWRQFYISGGMPSAHSATMISITTVIGLRDGFTSGLFGLAVMVSVIVMYDAMMVRRSSGAQGEALKALITEVKSGLRAPKVVHGHQPREVLVGALVGAAVGYIVFLATI